MFTTCRKSGILAEQLAAAEAKVRRLEAVAAAHSELQAQVQPHQAELQLWRSTLAGAAGATSGVGPEAVLQLLEKLRGQVLASKERAGEKEAEARRLQGLFVPQCTVPPFCLLHFTVRITPPLYQMSG